MVRIFPAVGRRRVVTGSPGDEIGEFRFQGDQIPKEEVIIGVGDLRIIQLVVAPVW